jgi:rhodanese-related sulfurtransferase
LKARAGVNIGAITEDVIMTKWLMLLLALCFSSTSLQAEVLGIDNVELERLAASGVRVIDVRTEAEWKSTGVVPGSVLLTFFDEAGRSDPPQWLERVKQYAAPGQPVILICRSGSRSAKAASFLSAQSGYKTVYNVSKGMIGWTGEGRATVPPPAPSVCAPGGRC